MLSVNLRATSSINTLASVSKTIKWECKVGEDAAVVGGYCGWWFGEEIAAADPRQEKKTNK